MRLIIILIWVLLGCWNAFTQMPHAMTLPAEAIGTNGATLTGMAMPNGLESVAWFEWGTNFENQSAFISLGSGTSVIRATALVTNLSNSEDYYFHLVVSNSAGVVYGFNQLFATGRKVASWTATFHPSNAGRIATNTVAIAAGGQYSLTLKNNGTLAGDDVPAGISNVIAISAGPYSGMARKSDGTVAIWRHQILLCLGELSPPTTIPASVSNVIAITAGEYHNIALQDNGRVVAWGCNTYGQTNIPIGLSNVVAIAAGDSHNLALKSDRSVVVWGTNQYGSALLPPMVTNVVAIGAIGPYSGALRADGTVITWGIVSSPQTNFPPSGNVISLAVGGCLNVALLNDESVMAWRKSGCNSGNTNVPVGLSNVVAIAAGNSFNTLILALAHNVAPISSPTNVTGYVNSDIKFSLPAVDSNGDPIEFTITSLPASGQLYQYVGGSRGAAITVANTAVTDSQGRIIFTPDGFSIPTTTFTFKCNDGETDSSDAQVTVNVILPATPQFVGIGQSTSEMIEIRFTGTSNVTYRIWASSNLVNWEVIGDGIPISPGLFRFADSFATNAQRFFRAGAP